MLVPQDPSDQEALKSWLVSTLVPLCQADPEALAKYVMALIKKDKQEDELKTVCLDQLKVFLEDNTKAFVDEFFTALKDRNYLASASKRSGGHPRRLKEKYPGRRQNKRSASRSPPSVRNRAKRPVDREDDRGRRVRSTRQKSIESRIRQAPSSSVIEVEAKPKTRCRDFDEKGVCLLGDLCLFDHGSDPVVLDAAAGPIFNLPTGASSAVTTPLTTQSNQSSESTVAKAGNSNWPPEYDPREGITSGTSIANTTPPVRSGSWNYAPTRIGSSSSGTNATSSPPNSRPNLNLIIPESKSENNSQESPVSHQQQQQNVSVVSTINQSHSSYGKQQQHDTNHHRRGRGSFPRGMRGNGRFGRGRIMQTDPSEKCTLEVRKLPSQLNTITTLNEFFSKFGTIVNLQVRYQGDPEAAVVQFATHNEAVAAHRCPDAVLGNRFIKLFWHNKEQEKLDPTPEKVVKGEDEGENTNQITKSTVDGGVKSDTSKVSGDESTDDKINTPDSASVNSNETTGPRTVLSQPNPIQIPARKQLTKSNVTPASSSSAHSPSNVPMTKTPSEQKKEKFLQKNEIKKKCSELLTAVRKDQAAVAEKLMTCGKDERSKMKELFDILDKKRKTLEEDLMKVSGELLKECKATGKRGGRERPTPPTLTGSFPKVTSPSKKLEKDSS